MTRKGIILAGGAGTRLDPVTRVVSKQLLPVYDKPMIYYPLSTLLLAGVRDILVITTPSDRAHFHELLGDGSQLGLQLSYAIQAHPDGLAAALRIGREFLRGHSCALILGDNFFYGNRLTEVLQRASEQSSGATIFTNWVQDPEEYGVLQLDEDGDIVGIEEKPEQPTSNFAVTGLYFYDERASDFAAQITPSPRGELEITDLNNRYLELGELNVEPLGRGFTWLDMGTPDAVLRAASYVQTLERRQGLKISCPEEIAYRMGFIDATQLAEVARSCCHNGYQRYLLELAAGRDLSLAPQIKPPSKR